MPPDGLTPQARRMLAILRQQGDWMNRAELAEALQISKLVTHHAELLQSMVDKGLIEIRPRPTGKKGPVSHEYRAKP